MRKYAWLCLSIGLTLSLVGCGDSESGNGGSGGGAGSGGSGSGGAGGSGTATVSGVVLEAALEGEDSPFEGATVSVGSATATSGQDGSFTMESPVGTQLFLTEAADHWGTLFPDEIPSQGRNDLELQVIPDALVAGIGVALGITVDPTKGLVSVSFDEDTAAAGDKATLSAGSETSFVFDGSGAPVEGNALLPGGVAQGDTEVIFVNVDLTAQVTVTASNAADEPCVQDFSSVVYPVEEKVLTEVEVTCP
jgi:hypothetical protein